MQLPLSWKLFATSYHPSIVGEVCCPTQLGFFEGAPEIVKID